MNITLTKISVSKFKRDTSPTLFSTIQSDRAFAILSVEGKSYKISWQSELVEPIIKTHDHNICLIGIDLDIIIFDHQTGKVFLKLQPDYNFYDFKIYNNTIYAITEIEIIRIRLKDFEIIDSLILPDTFSKLYIINKNVTVEYFGGKKIVIPQLP